MFLKSNWAKTYKAQIAKSKTAKMTKVVVISLGLSTGLAGCATFDGFFSFLLPSRIEWNDTKWCVPLELRGVVRLISRKYGKVRIHSTHRWPLENKRKGGKPKSYHLKCRAVDFSVAGDPDGVLAFIKSRPEVGGYSRYPQGFYHIDNGPRRTW